MRNWFLAMIVIFVVVVLALGLALAYNNIPPLQHKMTSQTARTCTQVDGTNGFYSFYCAEPLRITGTNGPWNFTVSISSDSVAHGQTILLTSSLNNTAGQNQTVRGWVEPSINPGIYSLNGTLLWQWNPPQHTLPSMTFAVGQAISESVSIPTSWLKSGQSYLIEVQPLSIRFQLNVGETPFTFRFSVH